MAVIIRLQNLSWSATAPDIRKFFNGLSIPNGGVHIVGGDEGDCFVAFATDEDARKAMKLDGGKLANQKIKLLLSSKAEMEEIIAIARGEKPAPPSSSATSLTSAQSRDAPKEQLRHRSRSRSPRRIHSSPDRSRNSRRDSFRESDRGSNARGPVARETGRGTASAANRTSGISPDGRDAHRREIAKVDPLPLSGPGQTGERRLVQQPAGDGSSAAAQPKFYGTAQMAAKDRGMPAEVQPPPAKKGTLTGMQHASVPVSDSRWLDDPQGALKGSPQQFTSSYGEANFISMQSGVSSGWDKVGVSAAVDRQMHRKNSDGWSVGPPLKVDHRSLSSGEPTFPRAIGGSFQLQAGSSLPPAVSNKGRPGGPGGRPPALLPTPAEPVLPRVEQEVEAVPPLQSIEPSAARRGLPRVASAAQFDLAAPASFDSYDRLGPFDRLTAAPFDRPVVSTYDHEHGVTAAYDRATAVPFERSGPAFEPMEARAFPPGPALPAEPALRIFNLVQTTTKKALRAFFAKNAVHPVDIKLVRRWHGDNMLGYALFNSASEAATVMAQVSGLIFEGGEPLSFEPCARAEYDAVDEHGPAPAPRGSVSQLCVTFTDLPSTATIKDLEELLAHTEYVVPSLYVEHDVSGLCTGAAYVELCNVPDYETVLAMRKRVSIHGQIVRVRPINKEEMKARVVHHKDNLLALGQDSMVNAVMFHGGSEVVRPALLDSDVFRRSPPMLANDRRQRFMGPADGLGPLLPAAEGPHPLLSPPVPMGPDRGVVLHLTDLPVECNVGRLMDFLQPAQIDPNYVRVLSFPDGSCNGEAFVKVFHPHDVDHVLQHDRLHWAGRLVRVWKANEKFMEDVVASFESQFTDYDGGRGLRARAESHLDQPRWRPRYDGHDSLPAL